ncbi:outer membrane protein assembly factor BamE [Entomomonas asaccharolytica]|uniref:Outer membrane protein assembly factor BamE n=1 Tax=Entomomonas asaccharolytica TaxID=2785331 RepID=A0A974NG95_9GAMM|nr:outer membrane protein assembly factor BamE [Entomomonas asaccharolytica]QQP85817.1 outer membrane protein assembly factor BamE [Entomomonas asaccharolytica]
MQKPKFTLFSGIMIGLLTLSGCFPSVYKIDIQQGNIITQDMINQLRPGMTRAQVRYLMGSPLITDPFHANRWDYIYSIQPGGGAMQQENVSLTFNADNQLIGLAGDFLPGMTRDEEILGGKPTIGTSGSISTDGSGSLEEQIQREVDSTETMDIPIPDTL